MISRIAPVLAVLLFLSVAPASAQEKAHPIALDIFSQIIFEMAEGKLTAAQSQQTASTIANAANKYFNRVTCGDMWLYLAMVYIESGFRNNIINHHNCHGMFQVHAPSWARKFHVRYADLLDLRVNAECGIQIFKYYLEMYGNVVHALSAYNSDHPRASTGYARAVLATRDKIKRQYIRIYREHLNAPVLAAASYPR